MMDQQFLGETAGYHTSFSTIVWFFSTPCHKTICVDLLFPRISHFLSLCGRINKTQWAQQHICISARRQLVAKLLRVQEVQLSIKLWFMVQEPKRRCSLS